MSFPWSGRVGWRRAARALLPWAVVALSATGCTRLLYNFGTVREREIYRSAQPSPALLRHVAARYGIRSIVNLRGRTPGYESAFAARHGLRLFVLDLSAAKPPSALEVRRFLDIVSDPENQPVLVHCRNGVDRSGYMIGVYRIEREGWSPGRALREMNRFLQLEWPNSVPQRVVRDGLRAPPGTEGP
jgi:protein tyrosine/serine phosphatase